MKSKSKSYSFSLNNIFTYIFIAEMIIKLIALTPMGYIRDSLNIIDGLIVAISIIYMSINFKFKLYKANKISKHFSHLEF